MRARGRPRKRLENDRPLAGRPLSEFVPETLWRWHGREDILEFAKRANVLQGNLGLRSFDIRNTPYLKEVFKALADPEVHTVVLRFGSQLAKTTAVLLFLLWYSQTYAVPGMHVYADEDLRKDGVQRVENLILLSPELRHLGEPSRWRVECIEVAGVPIHQALARSSSDLSSRAVGLLLLDEVGKFPPTAGSEGTSPVDQAMARMRTFRRRKALLTSTPEDHDSPINKWYNKGSREYWCVRGDSGRLFPWHWAYTTLPKPEGWTWRAYADALEALDEEAELPFVRFPDGTEVRTEERRDELNDAGCMGIEQDGEWIPRKWTPTPSFCVGAMGGRATTMRELGVMWARAEEAMERGDDSLRRAFFLHQMGEPYTAKSSQIEAEALRAAEAPGVVRGWRPESHTKIITGCDVQRDCIWYARLSANLMTQQVHLVDCGRAGEMDLKIAGEELLRDGGSVVMDSGDGSRTPEVYAAARKLRGRLLPIKGKGGLTGASIWFQAGKASDGSLLLRFDTERLRNATMTGLERGWFTLFEGAADDPDLLTQFQAARKKNGKWVREGGTDHLLDAIAYALGGLAYAGLWSNVRTQGTTVQAAVAAAVSRPAVSRRIDRRV